MESVVKNIQKIVEEKFSNESNVLAVYLIGSYANGNYTNKSDIDLAIVMTPGLYVKGEDIFKYMVNLAELPATVDIGFINSKSMVYSYNALTTGQLLYCRDKSKLNVYKQQIMSMYFTYKMDIKEVTDAYRAR